MTVKKSFQGKSPHRYKDNPLEKLFAAEWQQMNDTGMPGRTKTTLDYLMDENNRGEPKPPLSDRDWLIANTLVQWLGSPIGQCFLVDVLKGPQGRAFRDHLEASVNESKTKY